MKKIYFDPYWVNDEKTQIVCKIKFEDGSKQPRIVNAAVNEKPDENEDWVSITSKFSREEIDENTRIKLEKHKAEVDLHKEIIKEKKERARQKDLFSCKLAAFDMDEVKDSSNRILKAKIRRAKSIFEVNLYTGLIVQEEHKKLNPDDFPEDEIIEE